MATELEDMGLKSALDSVTTRTQKPAALSDEEKSQREGFLKWQSLVGRIGERYAECKLRTFVFSEDASVRSKQSKVIESLREYGTDMPESIARGQGLVLYGPAGTGKDHLLSAMMAKACWHNLAVEWRNGMDLYADRRDAISRETPERDLIRDLTVPDVLAISDPIPPWGTLTEGQAEFLFRVVDARYRRRKPIWVTANFAEGKEAESRIGSQVVDRLRDGALALHCNWPSYRRTSH